MANIVVFVVTMFVNDCPKNSDTCIGRFLGRLSFQPFKENHVRKDGCSRRAESDSSTPGMAADLISNWFPISHVWFCWEFAFSSFYSIWYFCWCFWCTFWFTRKHAFRAHIKLDNVCK
ncbi:unnamed protein product [Malus baccata var. baccata]